MTSADAGEWAALRAALADQYTLEREIGRGGMATVFLAQDRKHDRPVALKVLSANLGAVLGAARFRREIAMAARLHHPHVLSVFDSGEAAGRLWYSMPYVAGESLRDRLTRELQLPVDDAVRIAREAANGLHYAHRQGIVHRDVKPENILLTEDGTTLVADFGIAHAPADDETGGAARLTGSGLTIGTPAYMSPEQAAGERNLDGRSDVYALGAVLYEMLAGEPPFTGPTPQAVLAKILTTPAPSARVTRPGVPPALDAALARALATVPADRFATAAEFAQALEASLLTPSGEAAAAAAASPVTGRRHPRSSVVLLLAGAALGVGALLVWWRVAARAGDAGAESSRSAPAAATTRLAVLPFENLGRPEDAYVADGLTDEIRSKLAGVPGVQVIARASSNQYRQTGKTLQQIAAELGVQYLLTATVRTEPARGGKAARVRVSPELVQLSGTVAPVSRWAQQFDAELTDVFAMQGDIATRVAGAMDVALGGSARARLAAAPTRNADAYDAYLRAEAATGALTVAEPNGLRRALGYYAQAVKLDPGFAEAWAGRSRAASALYYNAVPTAALAREAKESAARALEIAPERADAHLALGASYALVEKDYARALVAFEAGRRVAPDDVELLTASASAERSLGQVTAAIRDFRAAAALDPRSAAIAARLAVTLIRARQYAEARAAADRALALAPGSAFNVQTRAMVELGRGDLAGARAILAAAPATLDRNALGAVMGAYWDLAWVLDDAGQQRLLALGPDAFDGDRGNWAWVLAQTYALRGDDGRARAYADSASAAYEAQLRDTPDDAQRLILHGLTLAMVGRGAEGVREAERGASLLPTSKDAYTGAYLQHQLARVYLLAGQRERALDVLEPLLRMPYYLSPGWLRIDPTWAPLRGNPRFERLLAERR
ncbi:MAG TPA: protein kinase [Gemmatimonadaceae bacterium]|nr:protein kinase [Gemmatimonadaceae bacterium]